MKEGPSGPFALGTAQWGMPYGVSNRSGRPPLCEVAAILDAAKRIGIDSLDTARAYGDSEAVIGELTADDRHWKITTKLAPDLCGESLDCEESLRRLDLSLESSLYALRREFLDAVLLHRAQHHSAHDGALWNGLCERRARGEIGEIGVSVGSPEEAWALLDDPSIDLLQLASSLLDQRLARQGFFEAARQSGVRIVVRSVFLQGSAHLEVDELPPRLRGLSTELLRLDEWAKSHGLRRSDAFILYARDLLNATTLLGCESVGQLLANAIAWRSLEVARDELAELAASVTDLGPSLLDPSRWPVDRPRCGAGGGPADAAPG